MGPESHWLHVGKAKLQVTAELEAHSMSLFSSFISQDSCCRVVALLLAVGGGSLLATPFSKGSLSSQHCVLDCDTTLRRAENEGYQWIRRGERQQVWSQ